MPRPADWLPLRIVPMPVKRAMPFVAKHHRHNRKPNGGLFAAGIQQDGVLVGVAIAATPVALGLCDGTTVEITRVCVLDSATTNACSMLYGALCRAAKALGYSRAVSYTLADEPGTSLLAAGFRKVADLKARPSWSHPSRPRNQVTQTLFGDVEARPPGPKSRWERTL